jgi:hypothetical protein
VVDSRVGEAGEEGGQQLDAPGAAEVADVLVDECRGAGGEGEVGCVGSARWASPRERRYCASAVVTAIAMAGPAPSTIPAAIRPTAETLMVPRGSRTAKSWSRMVAPRNVKERPV